MRPLLIAAGMIGFLAVSLGAFGAHGLEGRLIAEAQGWFETATLYALAHSVAALAVALLARDERRVLAGAGWAFVVGAVFFSGSLYLMALLTLAGDAPRWLGLITPLGGLCFLAGWGMIVFEGARRWKQK